jgi:hypothetical protein
MRRFARRLFTLCPAVSLGLCLAVCVLWARSYGRLDAVALRTGAREYHVGLPAGRLLVGTIVQREPGRRLEWISDDAPIDVDVFRTQSNVRAFRSVGGFGGFRADGGTRGVFLPCWFLTALLAVAPALRIRWRVRSYIVTQRLARGRCPGCGYDLRATPGRCPECGWRSE